MKKETGSVVPLVIILVVIAAAAAAGFILLNKPSPRATTPATGGGQLTSTSRKGDINRDGAVNEEDAEIIRKASPCNHVDPCWSRVAGKTKDGDNPMYVSDLDLNHDDNVNELDISAMAAE